MTRFLPPPPTLRTCHDHEPHGGRGPCPHTWTMPAQRTGTGRYRVTLDAVAASLGDRAALTARGARRLADVSAAIGVAPHRGARYPDRPPWPIRGVAARRGRCAGPRMVRAPGWGRSRSRPPRSPGARHLRRDPCPVASVSRPVGTPGGRSAARRRHHVRRAVDVTVTERDHASATGVRVITGRGGAGVHSRGDQATGRGDRGWCGQRGTPMARCPLTRSLPRSGRALWRRGPRARRCQQLYLAFAQILSEFGGWCRQSPTACEQTARCRGYCQQKAVMAAEPIVVTGQNVTVHSALTSTQRVALSTCSSVSTINTTCSGRDALELASNLRER